MSPNSTNLWCLGQFHDRLQMAMVATSTTAAMECALKEVLIQASISLAWDQPKNYSPNTQIISESNHAGLSIFTRKRLTNLWNKYSAKEISLDQLRKEWALGSDEEEV